MFQRAPRTERMMALLRGTNGTLTYQRIEQEFGEPLSELRPTVTNARHYLERDEGIVFVTERRVGYRRLSDAEKVASAEGFRHRIRRTAIRGVVRVNAVSDMAALSNEDQLRATIQRTMFEAIQRETGEQGK